MDLEHLLLCKLQDLAEFLRIPQELTLLGWNTCYGRLSPEHPATLERFTPVPRSLDEGSLSSPQKSAEAVFHEPEAIPDHDRGNSCRKPAVTITSLSTIQLSDSSAFANGYW